MISQFAARHKQKPFKLILPLHVICPFKTVERVLQLHLSRASSGEQTNMDSSINSYRLFGDEDESQEPLIHDEVDYEGTTDIKRSERTLCNWCLSLVKYLNASFQMTVICGVLFGLIATLLWWIELNLEVICFGFWSDIAMKIRRYTLMSDVIKAFVVFFWPLLTITPICSWSMIKESNLLFWCTIGCFVDAFQLFSLYVFDHYDEDWGARIEDGIFSVVSLIVFYKCARYRQHLSSNNNRTLIITLTLAMQFIAISVLLLPYNFLFLKYYRGSTHVGKILLSCSLIPVFYIPKLIIGNLLTNLHGIYKPSEGIVFASGFLVISTMVTRLAQAGIENLTYFTIVSIFHGIVMILDKLSFPLRVKLFKLLCRKRGNHAHEVSLYTQHYTAHQSLISIMTETSSVIMSNAAACLLAYYYKRDESTGKRYSGWFLLVAMIKRSAIAVSIEWIFNSISSRFQNERFKIPVLRLWKIDRRFILVIHLIQTIYVVVYFAHHANLTLLQDVFLKSNQTCIGLFEKL